VSDAKPVKPGHVRVIVRAHGVLPFGWAGRSWPNEPVTFDANANDAKDLLKAPPQNLHVTWPVDYVAHDGTMPGRVSHTAPKPAAPALTPAERLLTAEKDAATARASALATEREFKEYRAKIVNEQSLMRAEVENAKSALTSAQAEAAAANARAAAAIEHATSLERGQAEALTKVQEAHVREMEQAHAEHDAELTAALDRQRIEYEQRIAALNADLAKAQKKKPDKAGETVVVTSGTAAPATT
jgi:chromosome segregation ATPase